MLYFLKNLLQLILSPGNGWEDIATEAQSPERIFMRGYIPLISLTALSALLMLVYHPAIEPISVIITVLVTFAAYFTAYYIGTLTLNIFIDSAAECHVDDLRCRTFTLYSLGLMALVTITVNCLPVSSGILFFLPLYVAVIMWKAASYLYIAPLRTGMFIIMALCGIMAPVYIILMLFTPDF